DPLNNRAILFVALAQCQGLHLIGFQLPFGKEAVAREAYFFTHLGRRCVVGAVKICLYFAHYRPEFFQIKKGIASLSWFKRPLNELHAVSERSLTLRPLKPRSYSRALIARFDGRHVRVKCAFAS